MPFTVYYNLDRPAILIPALLALTFGIVGWTIVNTWLYNNTRSVFLMILLHGWNNTVQSFLVLSQPSFAVQTLYAAHPWALAIYLIKRYGEEHLGPAPRPKWWPGTYDVEQRAASERPASG